MTGIDQYQSAVRCTEALDSRRSFAHRLGAAGGILRYHMRASPVNRSWAPSDLDAKDSLAAFTIFAALCRRHFCGSSRSQPNSSLGIASSYVCRETRWRLSWRPQTPSDLGDSIRFVLPSSPLFGVGAVGGFRPRHCRASAGGVVLVHCGFLRLRCGGRLTGAQSNAKAPFT